MKTDPNTPPVLQEILKAIEQDDLQLYQTIAERFAYSPILSSPWSPITHYPLSTRYQLPRSIQELGLMDNPNRFIPHTPIIELMGLPESGKTSLCQSLTNQYPSCSITDENLEVDLPSVDDNLALINLLTTQRKGLSIIQPFRTLLENKIKEDPLNETPGQFQLFTRGPNDILAFSIPLCFTLLEESTELNMRIREILHKAVTQLSLVDTVILFDNDIKTAQLRRLRQNKPKDGKVVNSRIWPVISEGYSWWIEYIYPLLRSNYGTGLIIVDGRRNLQHNNQRVAKYIDSILHQVPKYT